MRWDGHKRIRNMRNSYRILVRKH